MNKDIELLNRGILPDSLNFGLQQNNEIDVYKLAYNLRYKTTEYWESKFPVGHQSIPGFERIIEKIAEESISPLEEISLKQEISKKNNIDNNI
jgi:hypothetical protein